MPSAFFFLFPLFCAFLFLPRPSCAGEEENSFLYVNVPVTDLRQEPVPPPTSYVHDDLQNTQLLYGEKARLLPEPEKDGWLHVEAPEQLSYFQTQGWRGYQGWVRKEHLLKIPALPPAQWVVDESWAGVHSRPEKKSPLLFKASLGTRFSSLRKKKRWIEVPLLDGRAGFIHQEDLFPLPSALSQRKSRKKVLESARRFLGAPYFWGGLSSYDPEMKAVASVDCSGLAFLSHRVAGIEIPRDSREQFMKARRISKKELRPGDLVFLSSKTDTSRIVHVAFYLGPDEILEAPSTGGHIHIQRLSRKIGLAWRKIENGALTPEGRAVYFGTYFKKDR